MQTTIFVNISLKTLNPANAAQLTSIATIDFFGALAVRPEDSVLFGDNGDFTQLFTINQATGAEGLIGSTGRNFVGDLAFQAVPEPASSVLFALGAVSVALARRVFQRVSAAACEHKPS